MMYNNFKAVFKIFIFTCIKAIEDNIQYLLEFKMSISQIWLCEHNWDFPQVNISFNVIKPQIINDVQQFLSSYFNFYFYMHWSYRRQYTVLIRI